MSHGNFLLFPVTRPPPRAGEQAETAPQQRRRSPMRQHCRQTFSLQHRAVKLIARNRRFTVELSGARPRRWKSEFLSIMPPSGIPDLRRWIELGATSRRVYIRGAERAVSSRNVNRQRHPSSYCFTGIRGHRNVLVIVCVALLRGFRSTIHAIVQVLAGFVEAHRAPSTQLAEPALRKISTLVSKHFRIERSVAPISNQLTGLW